jgi:hypothetical protein
MTTLFCAGCDQQSAGLRLLQVLLATSLLATTLFLWRLDVTRRTRSAQSPLRRWYPRIEVMAAAVVTVLSLAWLFQSNGTLRGGGPEREQAFMTARGCFDFPCQTIGAGSSVILNNGGVFPELEDIARHTGTGESSLERLMLLLMGIANGLLFLTVSRFAGPAAAAPASTLTLALLSAHRYLAPVMDATATFFFATVAILALLLFVLTDNVVALVTAMVFVAHAFNVHVSAVTLLPAFALIPVMAGPSARGSLKWAAAGYFGSCVATSWDALLANWDTLGNTHLRLAFLVAAATLIGVGLVARPRFRAASKPVQIAIALAAMLAPFAAGTAFLAGIGHPVKAGYLQPVIVPLALVGTGLMAGLTRLLPADRRAWGAFGLPMAVSLVALCWASLDPP